MDLDLDWQSRFAALLGSSRWESSSGGMGSLTAQYLQLVLGLDPLAAGQWTLPPLAAGVAAVIAAQVLKARL